MEIPKSVDQRQLAVERFFAAHRDELAEQGSVVATYRRRGDRRLGPYYQLTCRMGERQVAVYLGAGGEFVDHVRERLAQLQKPRSVRIRLSVVRRVFRRQAKVAQQQLDAELGSIGLYRRGHEVRGWRTAAMNLAMKQPITPPVSVASATAVPVNQPAVERSTP